MNKTTRTKLNTIETPTEPLFVDENNEGMAEQISSEVLTQIKRIILLKKHGTPRRCILSELGISRSTYQRRMKLLRELNNHNPEKAKEAIHLEIAKIVGFYMMIKEEAMSTAGLLDQNLGIGDKEPVDPLTKLKGLEMALKAHNDLCCFLFKVGSFEVYKAEQKTKADNIQRKYVNKEMSENTLQLMDENQKLRENLEAARRGEAEPHAQVEIQKDWQSIFPCLNNEVDEPFEADTDFDKPFFLSF